MTGPGGLKGPPALVQHALGTMVMDIVRGEHGNAAMSMLGVVPREERSTESDGGGDVVEAPREAWVILQGLELRLGERVVIGHLGAAQRPRDPEVGEQLCGALARHRRPAVGVQGEDLGPDALFVAGLFDETSGQRRVLPVGDHPADRVAAEDVEHDVEVEVRPLRRPQQFGDIPGPGLVRGRGHQFGFGVLGMLTLIAPFSDRLVGGQDPIHRTLRAQVVAFVEQRRHNLRRRTVNEAWTGEHIEDLLALGVTQRPGGR